MTIQDRVGVDKRTSYPIVTTSNTASTTAMMSWSVHRHSFRTLCRTKWHSPPSWDYKDNDIAKEASKAEPVMANDFFRQRFGLGPGRDILSMMWEFAPDT